MYVWLVEFGILQTAEKSRTAYIEMRSLHVSGHFYLGSFAFTKQKCIGVLLYRCVSNSIWRGSVIAVVIATHLFGTEMQLSPPENTYAMLSLTDL